MPRNDIAAGLRPLLDTPELVEGWITSQAVALKDGTIRYTSYFSTVLELRFNAGERYSID